MKLTTLRPMLWTKEIKETIKWYESILGFQCLSYDEEWGWASLKKDYVSIMLALPNETIGFDAPKFTGSFYFYTEDVDALWAQLKDQCKVCYPIETFDYGMKEFAIYDNNGYLLQFGQELENPELDDLEII